MKFGKQDEFLPLLVQLNISTLQKRKPWRKKERYLLLENTLIFFFCYCKTTLVPLLINIAGRYFTNLQLLLPNFPYPSLLNPLTHTCTHTPTPQTHTNWSSLKSHVAFGKYFIIASQVDFLTLLPIWTWTISYSCLYQWY